MDAYTKYTWLFLLHHKSQALTAFTRFKNFAEKQTGHTLKATQTDNAKEFLCFKNITHTLGIHHRLICPHTHEQNGTIERKHRHITEMGLTLLVAATLPIQFWGEAFTTAMHIINALPSSVLSNKSPYQMLFKHKPDYTLFKTFGCACFPLLRPYHKHKLDFWFECCLFLGYSLHNKGYLCLSSNGKTYVSRYVIFNEQLLPYTLSEYNFTTPAITHPTNTTSNTHALTILQPPAPSFVHPPHTLPISDITHSPNTTPNTPSLTIFQPPAPSPVHPPHTLPTFPLSPTNHSSPSTFSPTSPPTPATNPINNHPMVTRSKASIFKPKLFHTNIHSSIPTTVHEALSPPPLVTSHA